MTTPKRTVHRLALEPLAGSRFQPTGFPDLGAATFERADVEGDLLLVESAQSMANHLEATTWDDATAEPADAVAALPHVRVVDMNGDFLSSSRLEAHRLASAYVLDATLDGTEVRGALPARFGLTPGRPLDIRVVAREVFALDPLSLVHGVFFAQQKWPWQPKIARAMTCFIEATNVRPAVSGGVKRDVVTNTSREAGRGSAEGYGMVPHHRVEYTAATITLYAVIDEQQLRSYGLSAEATELLSALANWQLAALLDDGLRLRTACDLVLAEGADAPDLSAARTRLNSAIDAARSELAETTEVVWSSASPAKKS